MPQKPSQAHLGYGSKDFSIPKRVPVWFWPTSNWDSNTIKNHKNWTSPSNVPNMKFAPEVRKTNQAKPGRENLVRCLKILNTGGSCVWLPHTTCCCSSSAQGTWRLKAAESGCGEVFQSLLLFFAFLFAGGFLQRGGLKKQKNMYYLRWFFRVVLIGKKTNKACRTGKIWEVLRRRISPKQEWFLVHRKKLQEKSQENHHFPCNLR